MAMTYRRVLKNPDINQLTGQHTIEVWIEEFHGDRRVANGVKEKYGVSAAEINQRYGGNVDSWLDWVGRDALKKHKARQGIHTELLNKAGASIIVE